MKQERLIDEGWIFDVLFSKNGWWGCKNFEKEYQEYFGQDFLCPDCGKRVIIETIEW